MLMYNYFSCIFFYLMVNYFQLIFLKVKVYTSNIMVEIKK